MPPVRERGSAVQDIARVWLTEHSGRSFGHMTPKDFEAMVVGWVLIQGNGGKGVTVEFAKSVHTYLMPEMERIRKGAVKLEVYIWNADEELNEKRSIDLTDFTDKGKVTFKDTLVASVLSWERINGEVPNSAGLTDHIVRYFEGK